MQQERAQTLLSVLVIGGLLQVALGVLSDTLVLAVFGICTAVLGIVWLWADK